MYKVQAMEMNKKLVYNVVNEENVVQSSYAKHLQAIEVVRDLNKHFSKRSRKSYTLIIEKPLLSRKSTTIVTEQELLSFISKLKYVPHVQLEESSAVIHSSNPVETVSIEWKVA